MFYWITWKTIVSLITETFQYNFLRLRKQPPEVFYKKDVFKNFANSRENTYAKDSFLIKLQAFCEVFKKTLFYGTLPDDCFWIWRKTVPDKIFLGLNFPTDLNFLKSHKIFHFCTINGFLINCLSTIMVIIF